MLDFSTYEFIDFGSSNGGCLLSSKKKLCSKSKLGLGIDLDIKKCNKVVRNGFSCIHGDATKIDIPNKCVDFCTISHFLEHLPDLNAVEKILKNACNAARNFVYIEGPTFDFDDYLNKKGFHFYWSNWHGHPTHLKVSKLKKLLQKNGYDKFSVLHQVPYITDSTSKDILPNGSPIDSFEYNKSIHKIKPYIKFNKEIFRSFIMLIWVGGVEYPKLYNNDKFRLVSKTI